MTQKAENLNTPPQPSLDIAGVSNNEVIAVPSDGVSVTGCPYRVQDSCNFKGMYCLDETCNIRAKPVTDC